VLRLRPRGGAAGRRLHVGLRGGRLRRLLLPAGVTVLGHPTSGGGRRGRSGGGGGGVARIDGLHARAGAVLLLLLLRLLASVVASSRAIGALFVDRYRGARRERERWARSRAAAFPPDNTLDASATRSHLLLIVHLTYGPIARSPQRSPQRRGRAKIEMTLQSTCTSLSLSRCARVSSTTNKDRKLKKYQQLCCERERGWFHLFITSVAACGERKNAAPD
jgi:hypothetical protein